VSRHGNSDGRVAARQFFDRQGVSECVGSSAAVLFGNGQPHETQLGQLGDDFVRKLSIAIKMLGLRRDLLGCEVAC